MGAFIHRCAISIPSAEDNLYGTLFLYRDNVVYTWIMFVKFSSALANDVRYGIVDTRLWYDSE